MAPSKAFGDGHAAPLGLERGIWMLVCYKHAIPNGIENGKWPNGRQDSDFPIPQILLEPIRETTQA
jgi:hypothetical protein